jgi:hypothetical protein
VWDCRDRKGQVEQQRARGKTEINEGSVIRPYAPPRLKRIGRQVDIMPSGYSSGHCIARVIEYHHQQYLRRIRESNPFINGIWIPLFLD